MNKSSIIFLTGPGGVGKSTTGKILADFMQNKFIDLDEVFCEQIAHIGKFIREKGYSEYCHTNSKLLESIIMENRMNTVIALSSGFLTYNNPNGLAQQNYNLLCAHGKIVLLLPSKSLGRAEKIVVKRQLGRRFGLTEEGELKKFRERYAEYQKYNYDLTIFSTKSPSEIAQLMETKLKKIMPEY